MLEFLKTSSPELIPIDEDPEVVATRAPLVAAQIKLSALEAEEKILIRMVTSQTRLAHGGRSVAATDEEINEASKRLSTRKGTQTGWYLPEVQQARDEIKALQGPYNEAMTAAKARATEAGEAQLKPLCQQVADALNEALALAEQLEAKCQTIGAAGIEKPQMPFTALLPGQLIEWQMGLARRRGLVD